QVQAVVAGHADICNQHRRRIVFKGLAHRAGGRKSLRRNGFTRKCFFKYPAYALVIVNNPNGFHAYSKGRIIRNSVWPCRESNSIIPPCCCTNSWAKLRPRPVPLDRPVTRG